ncbi:hypothetical protein GT360_07255 [Vibrio astriarenae]|uniref:Uncharacterized protein n=1 Tax=Vibrio astriarenae TaxID=1481923 RepID=A0A7Z2T2Y6_9VIBR|nr:hypothetical protein [Vibrio astriarenae]QIA63327.1 hypothetical protein GT360_07255 [Vibrio astriarenae]
MNQSDAITAEIEKEIQKASGHMMLKAFTAPLRLLVVWMKQTNERLLELETQMQKTEL